MKRLSLLVLIVVVCFISCFGCNTGGKNVFSIITNEVELSIEPGEHWLTKMKMFIFSVNKSPQLAVWIEDNQGNYISTITVTSKSAKNNWISAPKEGRPEALPVWNHKRQSSTEQIDIISSASLKNEVDVRIDNSSLTSGQEYNVYLEINHSFDYNNHWTKDNSGVNGQPSLVYHAQFIAGQQIRIPLAPIGYGSVDGSNGEITSGLENFTSALSIVKNVYITWK